VPGSWKIEVVASNIPQPAQDFALVVIAAMGDSDESSLVRATSNPELAIPDNDSEGISDAVTVEREGIASSVAVEVDITHSYVGDLVLELVSPDGNSIALHDRQGASSNNIQKRFDMHNTPELLLLTGTDITGEWRLYVSDNARVDVGTLHGWVLEILVQDSKFTEEESEPGLLIPDNNPAGIADSISIESAGNVRQLEVWVDITHTWIGDLKVMLTSPSGRNVLLHDRSGGSQDNLITVFDLESLPELTAFENTPGAGTWTLSVIDNAGRDTGKLNAWGLRFKQ